MSSAPEPPDLPAAPEFKNSMIYDAEGNLAGSITEDADGNIVYKPKQLTAGEQVQKKAIESTRQTLLQRLYTTPEEYTKAAQEEADAWAKLQNQGAQKAFEQDVARIGEVSNTRGLLGSKAYADIIKGREETQAKTAADIAGGATAMRENLIQAKKGQDYNLYNLYSGASDRYSQQAAQELQAAQGLYATQGQMDLSKYNSQVQAQNARYNQQMASWQANEPWRNYIMPAAMTASMFVKPTPPTPSDRRLKKNIVPLFKVGDVQFYEFEYDTDKWPEGVLKPQEGKHVGVMADEVRHIPNAVEPEAFYGFDMVRYDVVRRHLNMENA